MKIGIIADTHDNITAIQKAVHFLTVMALDLETLRAEIIDLSTVSLNKG